MKIILAPLAATRGQQERLFWASLLLLKLPLLRLLKCTFLSFIRKSYSRSQGAFVSTLLATRIYRINKDLTIYYNNGYVWSPLGPLFSVGIFPSSALARMPTFRLNLKSLFFYDSLEYPDFLPIKTKKAAMANPPSRPPREGTKNLYLAFQASSFCHILHTLHSLINVFAVVSFLMQRNPEVKLNLFRTASPSFFCYESAETNHK